jgi:hypothetical protein
MDYVCDGVDVKFFVLYHEDKAQDFNMCWQGGFSRYKGKSTTKMLMSHHWNKGLTINLRKLRSRSKIQPSFKYIFEKFQ